jgi:beta-galactosidase/beta-glucuronidase
MEDDKMTIPRGEFPRPDFERDNWLSLNGEWDFSIGNREYDRTIIVPYACEAELSGVNERGFHPTVYYRREVTLPVRMSGKQVWLHFGAVDYESRVWVNGQLVAHHFGGQTGFGADITDALGSAAPAIIEVEAIDDPHDLEMPRGKQFWEEQPRSIFYDRMTGIWQSVWLEAVSALHLKRCLITPLFDEHAVRFEYELSRNAACELETEIYFEGKLVSRIRVNAGTGSGSYAVQLDQDSLQMWNFYECLSWTPETPRLMDVTFRMYEHGLECDVVQSYFGMRKVSVENGIFMLNNHPYYQKLVLDQGYWSSSLFTAPDDDAYVQDISLVKAMGFNGVRKHQKVEDPRFLYHADRLGLLVWGEIGSAYVYSRRYAGSLYAEWQEEVLRDYNHPCIVVWTPLNESWGVQEICTNTMQQAHCQALYHITRSLDDTRLIVNNDGWEHTDGDLLTIHDYTTDGETLAGHFQDMDTILRLRPGQRSLFASGFGHRGQPVLVSEYGGVKFMPNAAETDAWGYCEVSTGEQFAKKYRSLTGALLHAPDVQGFCYTQLTDVGTEKNGLLTIGREPKIPLDIIRQANES